MRYEAVTVPAGGGRLVRRLRSFRSEVKRFRGLIRGLQPDLVIQVTATVPAVLTAATLEHVPTVVHADEILDAGFPPHSLRAAGGEVVLRFTARSAAGICACSGPVAAQYSRRGATAVETVLPSIAPSHGGRDPAACRKALGIPANGAVVLAVGSLSHGRGQDVLLRAVSLLAARLPHLRCLIVGASHPRPQDRRFEASLRQQAAGLLPSGHRQLWARSVTLPPYMRRLMLWSIQRGFPSHLAESRSRPASPGVRPSPLGLGPWASICGTAKVP